MSVFRIFRNKRDTFVVFQKLARKIGNRQLDTLTARANPTGSGVDILDDDETETLGEDFLVLSNGAVDKFRLRFWDSKRRNLGAQQSYTDRDALVVALNSILQTTEDDADLLDILLLDGTDDAGTNATDGIVLNAIDANGTDEDGGIVLENNTMDHIANPPIKSINLIENANDFNVIRNEKGSNVEFLGANKPNFFLGTLTAIAGSTSTKLSIRNDARTVDNNNAVFEFFDLEFTRFRNSSGELFANRDTAITELNILFSELPTASVIATQDFFHNDDNSQLTGRTFDPSKGPAFWGTTLKAGEELTFSGHSSGKVLLVGKFGGATSTVGQSAFNVGNWDKRIGINTSGQLQANGSNRDSSVAMGIGRQQDHSNASFAMRYDRDNFKLQLVDLSFGFEMIIGEADVAEDGSAITIHFAASTDTSDYTTTIELPAVTQRKVDLILHAEHTANDVTDDDYTNGVVEDAVFSMNKPLNKGEKLVFTPQTNHGAQAILLDYTGSSGSGTGETGVESRTNAGLIFAAHDDTNAGNVTSSTGFTINQYSSRYDTSTRTSNQIGRAMSIRYHTDNKIDLYDETAEEILFTKDSNADGNPITLFLAGLVDDSGSDKVLHLKGLNMEPVGTDMAARPSFISYTHGTSSDVSINTDPDQIKNRLYSDTGNQSSGVDKLQGPHDRVQYGATLRGGMETSFTGPSTFITSNKTAGNNFGVSTGPSVSNDWSTKYSILRDGELSSDNLINASITSSDFIDLDRTDASGSDAGDEVLLDRTDSSGSNAGGKIVIEQNDSDLFEDLSGIDMRLRYEHSTNLLHLDAIQNGVRKRIATGNAQVDSDGDFVHITSSGDDTKVLPFSTPFFYGMEYAHTATASPQEYRGLNNQFLDWPTQNTTLKADTVLRHIDGIMPGFKIHFQLPTETGNTLNFKFGDWKTGNAASGESNPVTDNAKWNWGFELNDGNEKILASDLHNMEFNKKHPFYNPGPPDAVDTDTEFWQRPNNENKKTNVSLRYHDNNTVDIFDEDVGKVILNYIGSLDGSAFKFAWCTDGDISNSLHPGYITNADPKVSRITEADGDLPNGQVSQLLRGKSPLLGAGYYVAYGPDNGTKKNTPLADRTLHPVYFSNSLDYRHEFTFNTPGSGQTGSSLYSIQLWSGNTNAPAGTNAQQAANVELAIGVSDTGISTNDTFGTDLSSSLLLSDDTELVLRYDYDGFVRLLKPSNGYEVLLTSNRSFLGENCLYIHLSGNANASDGNTSAPSFAERGDFWKLIAFDSSNAPSGYNSQDWRTDSITQHVVYQAVRPISPGQKYAGIKLPEQAPNTMFGIAYNGWQGETDLTLTSGNDFTDEIGASGSGLSFRWQTNEKFDNVTNATLNTSNSNYNGGSAAWIPGTVAGGINIEFRYISSSKKVEVWDADQNEKILESTNAIDASGRDITLVIGSVQNDIDDQLTEYRIEQN